MLRSRLITLAACLLLAVSIADAASDDASGKPVKRGYTPMPARSMRGGRWFGLDTVDRRAAFSVISQYDTKGSMLAAHAKGKARSKEEFLNQTMPTVSKWKYGRAWMKEVQDAHVDSEEEEEVTISDKLLMRDTIYIYRQATSKFLEAYNAYQVEKKWELPHAKKEARRRFALVVNTYMPALLNFADNFVKEDAVMTEAERVGRREKDKQKSGWDTFYSIVKGTLKVARVTLQVMSLNIPELSKELLEITTTISETISAVTDANDNLQDCAVGEYLGKATDFTLNQFKKAKEAMLLKQSAADKEKDPAVAAAEKKKAIEAANNVDKAELFKFMITMTTGLVEHYQNVVEFEGLKDEQRIVAKKLCTTIFWIKAPVDHSVERFRSMNEVQNFLCSYIEKLHTILERKGTFIGEESSKEFEQMERTIGQIAEEKPGVMMTDPRRLSTNQVMDRLLQQTDSQ